ncbi:hypothetical protein AT727_19015 [Desulfitobacterium hafniense]|uniref:histidine kinase n=1 Tax=Desulfitobacterium hafniense TaxID=49338 RepID=A0A0W1JMF4_DESHA|nr:ATP-binding protein [Desulfitobacterium hafniense]KTE92446.1 hypothetical protein AT727_19015 [Desulfitobacterium hafniense]
MNKSIFFKLLASYIGLLIVAITIIGSMQVYLVENYLIKSKEQEMVVRGQELSNMVMPYLMSNLNPRPVILNVNRADRILGTEVWVIDRFGKVITASADHLYCEGNTLEAMDLTQLQSGKVSIKSGQSEYFQEAVIRVVTPVIHDNEFIGGVILYSPVRGVNDTSKNMSKIYVGAALLGILISVLIGIIFSRQITKPIKRVCEITRNIADGKFDERVEIQSKDELGVLALSINHMSKQLSELESMRRNFVANVSHELRSPLTSIQGYIDALLQGKGKDKQEEKNYLQIVQKETHRLSRLVNDLLEISRFDSQTALFNMDDFPLRSIIDRAMKSLRLQTAAKDLIITTNLPSDLTLCYGDEDRIEQVIYNLLDNAIRYSSDGGEILISAIPYDNDILVEITDFGQGIPSEDIPFIWDRFYRVDKARSRNEGGTGLGLAIVKEIIDRHGGQVMVESTPGEGSNFGFTLKQYGNEIDA